MPIHKYQEILEKLQEDINSGHYKPGQRLPSEPELVRRYSTSRMTVFRAMRELQTLGLVTRKVGSGTYVAEKKSVDSHVFGLLIPDLGQTEIFETICQGMMEAPQALHHALLWGNTASRGNDRAETAEQLCRHYIAKNVSGVFFAPVEFNAERNAVNHRIVAELDRAQVPVVLLDRCLEPYPDRSRYDLIGIDNRRAAYHLTEHLLNAGAQRIAFFGRPNSAPTVDARISGYREAIHILAKDMPARVHLGDPEDTKLLQSVMKKHSPDAFICANDDTAGRLIHTLLTIGKRVPEDVRVAGFDDVKYASLLPVPLTTMRQPCKQIGQSALSVMLERIAMPDLPTRDVLLGCELVVRKSCGGTVPTVAKS